MRDFEIEVKFTEQKVRNAADKHNHILNFDSWETQQIHSFDVQKNTETDNSSKGNSCFNLLEITVVCFLLASGLAVRVSLWSSV